MSAPVKHLLQQGPVIQALMGVGWDAVFGTRPTALPALPAPALTATVGPRPDSLVRDVRRWAGGDPKAPHLPPHLFPQWGFPLLSRTLARVPYPLPKVLNQGCRITVHAPLPKGVPLTLTARLQDAREEPGKARLHQRLVTGTAEVPEAVVADVFAVVPLPREGARGPRKRGARPGVPIGARELDGRRFGAGAGRDFAILTGDINPIHVFAPAARAAGFRSCILHGFGTLAWAWEGLVARRLAGDEARLAQIDVRFTRPLVLPNTVRLYTFDAPADAPAGPDGTTPQGFGVAEAAGGPAFMLGTAWLRDA
jgi:acyl dehydratase